MECINQTLEQYLRVYCSYHQDDWHQLLPLAEFVYNNTQNFFTYVSPFFVNYGYHPRCKVTVAADTVNPAADNLVEKLHTIHTNLRKQLQHAQEKYKANHDQHVKVAPQFTVKNKVWLLRKNIRTTRPSQKLNVK